jgi:hypothetical protein
MRLLILAWLWLGGDVAAAPTAAPPIACADFLQQLGLQRPDVKFVTCQTTGNPGPAMDGLQAVYRVAGKDITNVEGWLVAFAHVKPLKFSCCGLETSTVSFVGRDGAKYTIGMGGETTESQRKDFSKIPFLNVYVTHYFYEP